ncbi:MAG: hypothetical protein JKY37_20950 [Nannocystaceae bacterium]|nr:hypothetical protein [Nannocystaceae bacterium]
MADSVEPPPPQDAAETEPSPREPVLMGSFAIARARDGSELRNTLEIGPRYTFSA